MSKTITVILFFLFSAKLAFAQLDSTHANEPIGEVRQVYDGKLMPDIQVNTFRNIDRLFPTRTIEHGESVFVLPYAENQLESFTFKSNGMEFDFYDYVSVNRVGGLVIIKNGEIVYETYQLGNTDKTRWMSMSVAKSITATLVGVAINDGYIKSMDEPITTYLTELKGSAYEGVTVKHLLQMASGVHWDEVYDDPESERRQMLEKQIGQEPGSIMALMASLPRVAEPGTVWNYSTGETQVLGALVHAATGKTVSDYLSERIWAKLGMESDATWWLDSPDGIEIGGSGVSATLRDYARFGMFLLNGGKIGDESLLPDGWLDAGTHPQVISGETVDYGYMFWTFQDFKGNIHEDAFMALGLYGQTIYVSPNENLIIVKLGATSKPLSETMIDDFDFIGTIATVLH